MADREESSGASAHREPLSGAPHGTPAPTLGSREHIRETLRRARAAVRTSQAGTASTRTVLARSEALAGEADRLVQESIALRAQLRASVTACVRHLRGDGVPSERMLVAVKAAVRESTPPELDTFEARELMEDVVRWSVEAYYHAG